MLMTLPVTRTGIAAVRVIGADIGDWRGEDVADCGTGGKVRAAKCFYTK